MEEISLTPEQITSMLEFWNRTPNEPPALKDIVKHVFGREDLDGRTKEAKGIKKALAERSLRATVTSEYEKNVIGLSEEQKTYIVNNAATMNALEIARVLFSNTQLTNLNSETRAVNEYIKTLDTRVVLNNGQHTQEVPDGGYEPPKTLDKALRRVNLYVNHNLDKEKLNAVQKKGLDALINYLHTYRFIKQINEFENESDRKSFEDAFVRYTYDKPDLSQEEVDEYILLATEVVISFRAQRRSERLQQMLENIADSSSSENARISMSLVDAISKAQTEYHQCVARQQKLLDDLKQKRSVRIGKQIQENASILNIIQEWKNEENRKMYLKMVEIEEQAVVAQEIEKIDSMEDIKARIIGLTKNEARNA